MNDVLSIASSGMQSSAVRLRNSAYNVANLVTEDFRSRRTVQVSRSGGGSDASTQVDQQADGTSIIYEAVEQSRAKLQFEASARLVKTYDDMKGTLLDAFA